MASSCIVIWKQPSPSMLTTTLSGYAICAPIAAGTPKPIVPRPPDVMKWRGSSICSHCAAHIWCWPTPVVQIDVAVGEQVAQPLDHVLRLERRRPAGSGTGA